MDTQKVAHVLQDSGVMGLKVVKVRKVCLFFLMPYGSDFHERMWDLFF